MAVDPDTLPVDVTNCISFFNKLEQQVLKLRLGFAGFGKMPSGQRNCNHRHYAIYDDEKCRNPDEMSADKSHGSQENKNKRNIDDCGGERSGEHVSDALELS